MRVYLWDGTTILGELEAGEITAGTQQLEVPLDEDAADGARLRVVASLEGESGTSAAAAAL